MWLILLWQILPSFGMDKKGRSKLVEYCSLPLTAAGCVDTLITERALFRMMDGAMTLCSIPPQESVDAVQESLPAPVPVAADLEAWG